MTWDEVKRSALFGAAANAVRLIEETTPISGPDDAKLFLRNGADAWNEILAKIDWLEGLVPVGLIKNERMIVELERRSRLAFWPKPPDGLPHESQSIAYQQWRTGPDFARFTASITSLYNAIPRDLHERFGVVVARLEKAMSQRDLHDCTTTRDDFNGPSGLEKLEASLGLATVGDESERIRCIVIDVERRVSKWEKMAPSKLVPDHDVFSALFTVTEAAHVFEYGNPGYLPDCWWGRLSEALSGAGLFDRLTGQIARETRASFGRQLLKVERIAGGKEKQRRSPKARAKAGAFELWKERYAGKHPKLRTVEQYATEVMSRWPVLTSAKVICGWSAKWSKEAKSGEDPAC